ncbi:hypothetical protein ABH925_003636 [Streptacidiphilus sp. EB129]
MRAARTGTAEIRYGSGRGGLNPGPGRAPAFGAGLAADTGTGGKAARDYRCWAMLEVAADDTEGQDGTNPLVPLARLGSGPCVTSSFRASHRESEAVKGGENG